MKTCTAAHTCELQGQSPPLCSCMTLGKSLHLSEPQFPHLDEIKGGLVCEVFGIDCGMLQVLRRILAVITCSSTVEVERSP